MQQGGLNKSMHEGNWTCGNCNTSITALPFKPKSTNNLLCIDCHRTKKDTGPQRQMHSGDWKCGSCNAPITELPFEPNENRLGELQCIDCYRKKQGK